MKNTTLSIAAAVFAALMLLCTDARAQVEKGALMVGGGINFQSEDGESQFQFEPNIGYFPINNLGVGVNFNIDVESEETQLEFGPYVRYYVWKGLFPQVGLLYNKTGEEDAFSEYNIALGYSLFANKNVAFEPIINYTIGDGYSRFYLGVGVQAFLGRK